MFDYTTVPCKSLSQYQRGRYCRFPFKSVLSPIIQLNSKIINFPRKFSHQFLDKTKLNRTVTFHFKYLQLNYNTIISRLSTQTEYKLVDLRQIPGTSPPTLRSTESVLNYGFVSSVSNILDQRNPTDIIRFRLKFFYVYHSSCFYS